MKLIITIHPSASTSPLPTFFLLRSLILGASLTFSRTFSPLLSIHNGICNPLSIRKNILFSFVRIPPVTSCILNLQSSALSFPGCIFPLEINRDKRKRKRRWQNRKREARWVRQTWGAKERTEEAHARHGSLFLLKSHVHSLPLSLFSPVFIHPSSALTLLKDLFANRSVRQKISETAILQQYCYNSIVEAIEVHSPPNFLPFQIHERDRRKRRKRN